MTTRRTAVPGESRKIDQKKLLGGCRLFTRGGGAGSHIARSEQIDCFGYFAMTNWELDSFLAGANGFPQGVRYIAETAKYKSFRPAI